MMKLRVSKHLDVPAHMRRRIKASAFPFFFQIIRRSSMGFLPNLSMPRDDAYPGRRRCGSITFKICMETALFQMLFFHD